MAGILVLSRNFPPVLGGMERLNQHLVSELSRFHAVHLVAPEGANKYTSEAVCVSHVKLRPLWLCLLGLLVKGLCVGGTWQPALVLGGSGLVAPVVWIVARLCNAKAAVYVHGLDITVPHSIYRHVWLPFLRHMDSVVANSHATKNLAVEAGIPVERISILNPGVAETECSGEATGRIFRERHQLENKKILLSVGRLAARKGLKEFVRDVLPKVVAKLPALMFVIIGSVPKNALYAEVQSPEEILAEARKMGLEKHLIFLGQISNEELLEAYASADLHVFPVIHIPNNPEGFGMVAIEAAMQGVATVSYATGGVIDAVENNRNGLLVQPGNADEFAKATIELLEHPLDKIQVRDFSMQFTWNVFGEKLKDILDV